MKISYFSILFVIVVVSCFYSCNKDENFQQSALVGTWNMQKQSFAQYENNRKISDTVVTSVVTSSNNNTNSIQFYADGNYTVSKYYYYSELSGAFIILNRDTTRGVFSLSGKKLNLSNGTTGLTFYLSSYDSGILSNPVTLPLYPTIETLSHTIQVTKLTSSILILHTDYTYSYNYPNTTISPKKTEIISDYYYSK